MTKESKVKANEDDRSVRTQHASHWEDVLQKEFARESDRAAVILVASIFDNSLTELLRNYLVANPTSDDEIFDGANAPLSTFNAKINMSFRLGLVSSNLSRDLHLIRRIRNEFAHDIHHCSFEDSRIRSRVMELYKSTNQDLKDNFRDEYPEGPRGDFILVLDYQ